MMIFFSSSFYIKKIKAQKLNYNLTTCYSSAQARYECFIKHHIGALERAKEIEANRRSISDAKEKLRIESVEALRKQQRKKSQEVQQQLEYSRSRNVSRKGEKYSITYGLVIEPGP